MAKIDANKVRGSNLQPVGTMPKDMLLRHKLTGNMMSGGDASFRRTYRHNRKAKQLFQDVKTYRQYVHKSNEKRLPSSLRLGTHYMLHQMSKSDAYATSS